MTYTKILQDEIQKNKGILRLAPAWVARRFMIPGRRMKLHPRDVYAYGVSYGGINERWLASTTLATKNGGEIKNEGLSAIVIRRGTDVQEVLLRDAVDAVGHMILGDDVMNTYGGWTMYSKFFDNKGPISFHLHMMGQHAKKFGEMGKPEAYYYPPQMNFIENNFPHTYFGLEPGTRREDLIRCIRNWEKDLSDILKYSRAYRLEIGTGWDVPAGVIHAPGSLVTYEPQRSSDVNVFYQNVIEGRYNPRDPAQYLTDEDYEYFVDLLDWELNTDVHFRQNRYRKPIPVKDTDEMREEGYIEKWICYGRDDFCAKELTILPGRTVTIRDCDAYGLIMVQGYGTMNGVSVETPAMIRFEEYTSDEMFVTKEAAEQGVVIQNISGHENIVMLKHFGPGNKNAMEVKVDKHV